jgi:hypothetical protein
MSIRIRELRLSFIWFERWSHLWDPGPPIAMQFLRSAADYAKEFDQMIAETVLMAGREPPAARMTPTALTPPWPFMNPNYKHYFWVHYLKTAPANVKGNQAFRKLVPFRTGVAAKISSDQSSIRVITDGFIYPHGVGLVLALRLFFDRGKWPAQGIALEQAVEGARLARSEQEYEVAWQNSKTAKGKLADLANLFLDDLRERVRGAGVPAGEPTQLPFSVASVIRGDSELTNADGLETGDVHAALQGLCTLRRGWQADSLTPFLKSRLRIRQTAPKAHLLYHTDRARAVWSPTSFRATGKFNRTVGCYHRNLTLLHLQTEALLQALTAAADLIEDGETVPQELRTICENAAIRLSAIYNSETSTYRSSSPRFYLDENPALKKLVNTALADFKKDPLKYEEAAT